MMAVIGLDKHMLGSKQSCKYSHLDIAGSAGLTCLTQPRGLCFRLVRDRAKMIH